MNRRNVERSGRGSRPRLGCLDLAQAPGFGTRGTAGIGAVPRRCRRLPSGDRARSLAGQFLVASPTMGDPRFERTVILMVRHDRTKFGIVVNRPIGERPLTAILQLLGDRPTVPGTVRILQRPGPAQAGFVIHSPDYKRRNARYQRARGHQPRDTARHRQRQRPGQKPDRVRLFGLGTRPARGELARRDWVIAPADPADLRRGPRQGRVRLRATYAGSIGPRRCRGSCTPA